MKERLHQPKPFGIREAIEFPHNQILLSID
jgi:hypothetical protein